MINSNRTNKQKKICKIAMDHNRNNHHHNRQSNNLHHQNNFPRHRCLLRNQSNSYYEKEKLVHQSFCKAKNMRLLP